MANSPETKVVLPPDAFVQLIFKLKGGTFLDADDADLEQMLKEMEFPEDEGAREAKLDAANKGIVLVNRSIVTLTAETGAACRALLLHRDEHVITTGASVLTSGDPRKTPADVLGAKVTIDPQPSAFERMGYALSDPKQTKGVHYLFDVHATRIDPSAMAVSMKDHATLVSVDDALKAIKNKQLETAILRRILEKTA